jgi:hypothetical protein
MRLIGILHAGTRQFLATFNSIGTVSFASRVYRNIYSLQDDALLGFP